MESIDVYQAVGGRAGCLQISQAFYARVKRDPILRPLFPGRSMRCAIEAFAAFLAQLLGGPAEDAQARWWISLRESHLRFRISPRERQAWMRHMVQALDDAHLDESVRHALRGLFEQSSAYIVNTGPGMDEPHLLENPTSEPIHREISQRWGEQRALDDLVAAFRNGDAGHVLKLMQTPPLQARFARDRLVFAHVLGLLVQSGNQAVLDHVEREIQADPALAQVFGRYGRTLLHDASALGNLRMVELLLRLGADPNAKARGGHPPLYCLANECAIGGGSVARALIRAGAHVDARSDSKQGTPLHMAARRGNTDVAEALLDCGADINAKDTAGVTPLERAKNCRKPAVAQLLVSRGANPGLLPQKRKGATPPPA